MSFVIVAPEALMSVASEVAGIGSALNAANAAAAAPTTGVLAAAADEVSAAMAALFGAHAQEYQRLSAQAAGFHAQFVQALNAGVNSYASAEAANASPLQAVEQQVLGLINGPAQTLLGRPLIGNGADGAPGTGQPGGPGGLLWGNGGNGGSGVAGVGGPGGSGGAPGWLRARRHPRTCRLKPRHTHCHQQTRLRCSRRRVTLAVVTLIHVPAPKSDRFRGLLRLLTASSGTPTSASRSGSSQRWW